MLIQQKLGKETQSGIIRRKNIKRDSRINGNRGMEYPPMYRSLNSKRQTNSIYNGEESPIFYSQIPIQAKLSIGKPNDKYEHEADRVADKVMRMSDTDVAQRAESGTVQPMRIQQILPACDEELQRQPDEEKEETLQTKKVPGQTPQVGSGVEARINNLKSGGTPLDASIRNFFEPRFGHDFSNVRVYHDGEAASISRSINARAFTLGNHLVFGSGEYQPQSSEGKRLLGHELTHVVQQRGGWENTSSSSAEIEPFIQPKNIINPSENLHSERFAHNPRLEAAYDNAPPMRKGEVGEAVALVQETLVDDGFDMPISTKENGEMDGIFGFETFRTVWAFQDKHELDTDGVVGHDTLDELQVVEENKQKKPEKAEKGCPGIKKFGIEIAGSVSVVVHNHFPFAETRGGSANDIIYKTAGRNVKNSLFEIHAAAIDSTSLTGVNPKFEHGVIQTTSVMRFDAKYSGNHKAHRISKDSRDAETKQVRQPWVRSSGAKGSPRSLGDPFELLDAPQHHFPKEHPKHPGSDLERIKFKTVFDLWHIAKKKNSDGTRQSNLAFLSSFQISSESEAVKSKNNNFIGHQPNNRITRSISCGKGSAKPVLDTPITIIELKILHS